MKKNILFTVILFFTASVFCQATVNPSDSFYSKAQEWKIQGLIKDLPSVRPYPLNLIKDILTQVIQSDQENESLSAKQYWEEITGKSWNVELQTTVSSNMENVFVSLHPSINGNLNLKNDFVSMGYNLALDLRNNDFAPYLANYTFYPFDAIQDPATIGPLQSYLDMNNVLNIGNTKAYAQLGVFRTGYGEFLNEGLTLNDSAYHKGNLAFSYISDKFDYSQLFSVIGATLSYDGSDLASNKFLAFHSVKFKVIPKFDISYYENIIFGNRFDLSYLFPSPFMVTQGLGGCNDNLQMGLLFDFYPVKNLAFNVDVMVDDLDVNKLVKFSIDSKNRVAGSIGATYTPSVNFINRIDLSYTLITPYTYSHWDYFNTTSAEINAKTFNYQNYTNCGQKIGSMYDPNSDVIKLSAAFTPVQNFDITLTSKFIRHANVCESLTDDEILKYLSSDENVYSTDGTLYTHSMFSNKDYTKGDWVNTAWTHLNLLNQEHISYTFQQNIGLSYKLPKMFNKVSLSLNADYTFEYITNYGINNQMFPGGKIQQITHTKKENGEDVFDYYEYIWNGHSYVSDTEKKQIVDYYKDLWVSNLTNKINNVVSIYVLLRF